MFKRFLADGSRRAVLLVLLVTGTLSCVLVSLAGNFRHDDDLSQGCQASVSEYVMPTKEVQRPVPCKPQKIHLSQATDVHEIFRNVSMTVSFTLDHEECAHVKPVVTFGRRRSLAPEHEVEATDRLDFRFASPKVDQNYTSDWIYHVRLSGLKAGNIQYWYQISVREHAAGSDTAVTSCPTRTTRRTHTLRGSHEQVPRILAESARIYFQTPPLPSHPTTLALVGDVGQTNQSRITMGHVLRAAHSHNTNPTTAVNALLFAGDLSYADGEPDRWDQWLTLMEPVLRSVPTMFAPGNHEIECDKETHEILYRPSVFLGHYNYGNAFYTFRQGLAQVVVLNSYTDTTRGSLQYQWLEETLKNVDRQVTPWLLVMFHCPLYTTFLGHVNGTNQFLMLRDMEPLFVKYQVNLALSGHDHAFMRTHTMVHGKLDVTGKGPIYLTLGAGGNREGHTAGYIQPYAEPWVAKRDNYEYGYGHLYLPNATHALFNWVRDGTTKEGAQDHVWLENQLFR